MTSGTMPRTQADVSAVIVTYRPEISELAAVVRSAKSQTRRVFIIDNSEGPRWREAVQDLVTSLNSEPPDGLASAVVLIAMDTNTGLATGYNIAIEQSRSLGFEFVMLLDQDSLLESGAVDEMLKVYKSTQSISRVGAVCGVNMEAIGRTFVLQAALDKTGLTSSRARGKSTHSEVEGATELSWFKNSGTLIPLSSFGFTGLFNTRLFVDAVDYDFSFRLRDKGLRIFRADKARINHRQGVAFTRRWWGKELTLRGYGPDRSYHIVRDTLELVATWYRKFPFAVVLNGLDAFSGTVGAILLLDQRQERVQAVFRALSDFGHRA